LDGLTVDVEHTAMWRGGTSAVNPQPSFLLRHGPPFLFGALVVMGASVICFYGVPMGMFIHRHMKEEPYEGVQCGPWREFTHADFDRWRGGFNPPIEAIEATQYRECEVTVCLHDYEFKQAKWPNRGRGDTEYSGTIFEYSLNARRVTLTTAAVCLAWLGTWWLWLRVVNTWHRRSS
jgi:hypothetical protein